MNRIVKRFEELRARHETAFVPYITAGDPSLEKTAEIVCAMDGAGVDVVELGVPFSDPVGDGVVIQEAAQRALSRGVTPRAIMELVRDLRAKTQVPILLFTYFNPVLAYGVEKFAADAAQAGVDGVLCVDLPPEEAGEYKAALDKNGLCSVFLVAPTTPDDRIALITAQCSGFVYYVSRLGVTGERSELVAGLQEAVGRIKRRTEKPVAVGFGISTPQQAQTVAGMADGVVVGSAIVKLISRLSDTPGMVAEVQDFVSALVRASKNRGEE